MKKNRYRATKLYSLANFKTDLVRKDDDFELKYLEGRFGGIPFLDDFEALFHVEN
jgi:hypothetical protein